jgi:hypothetical protein
MTVKLAIKIYTNSGIVKGTVNGRSKTVKAVMELTDKLGADAIIDFCSPKNLVFEI